MHQEFIKKANFSRQIQKQLWLDIITHNIIHCMMETSKNVEEHKHWDIYTKFCCITLASCRVVGEVLSPISWSSVQVAERDAQIYLSIHQEARNEDALPRYSAPPDLGNGIMSGLLPGFIFPENGLFVVFCLFCQKERKSICLFYKHFVQSELNWKYQS